MKKPTANQIIALAKAEVGTKEEPAGSNKTKYGAWYPMNSQPWCAIFISWLFRENLDMIQGKFARTDIKAKSLKATKGSKGVKAGDIVFFSFNGPKYQNRYLGIHHVGICIGKLADGRFITIEGNTSASSNDNGGSVLIRYRAATAISAHFRPGYESSKVPVAATKPKPTVSATPLIRLGSKGAAVKKLQQRLKYHGYRVVVDGIFGKNTLAAVKAFQKKRKLTVDGVVGANTWKALLSK